MITYLITYLLSKIKDKDRRDDIVAGLAASLAFGLAFGLVVGLVAGLVASLAFGLVAGLVAGLAASLAFGLVAGLAFGLVAGLVFPVWLFASIVIIFGEVIYWFFDRSKYNGKENKLWFTAKRKGEALVESLVINANVSNAIKFFPTINWSVIGQWLWKGIVFIGIGTVGVAVIIGYLWLNSLKYKEQLIKIKHHKRGRVNYA